MTVAFSELVGSPYESFGPDGPKARREILVNWADRMAMVAELLGDGYEFGGGKRLEYPNWSDVVAMRIETEAWPPAPDPQDSFDDIAIQINDYTAVANQRFAKMTVHYELLVVEVGGGLQLPTPEKDTFLTYRMDAGGEGIKIPTGNLHWEDQPAEPPPEEGGIVARIPTIEHHLTWHRVTNPPITAIRDCVGRVNQYQFMGAPVGSMLCDSPTMAREFTTFDSFNKGQWAWALDYVFLERYPAWIKTFRKSPVAAPGWDTLLDGTNNPALFGVEDFTRLFQYEESEA